ncbi:MAG: DUF4268 domain-containing protein [Bacteroidetes bacterium]|nr:DUF4268 domain-containing protein [Bacteroidota bacterium]
MYSKEEASLIRKNFWTRFGQYMKPLPNADGEAINWLNYKTGVKYIFFRMDADNKQAAIAIELTHPDEKLRHWYFNKFLQIKPMLIDFLREEWQWEKISMDENSRPLSRIGIVLTGVNIFNTNDWPAIISFLKPRIIALDQFWSLVRDSFE